MSIRHFLVICVSGIALASGPGAAQSFRDLSAPAEWPPASYAATQYVDSKGCAFIRARAGGTVTWVPRLTRSHRPLCGFAPSLADTATPVSEARHVTQARGGEGGAAPPPGTRATPDTVPPHTRVAPARIYARQRTSLAGIRVPEGMKPVWEDDRLNPRRAHQTFEGKAQMERMWTRTVPRRLIDRHTGAEVIR